MCAVDLPGEPARYACALFGDGPSNRGIRFVGAAIAIVSLIVLMR